MDAKLDEAVAAKRVAIRRVGNAANPAWMSMMEKHVATVASIMQEFTTDDVFDYADSVATADDPTTPELRAMGAVMTRSAKKGIVARTEQYRKSNRRSCHNRPLAVWRSI